MSLRRTLTSDVDIADNSGTVSKRPDFEVGEGILQVAARLTASLDADKRLVLVTSYDDRDGASDLAAQLAIALARLSQAPVALVDGDRSRPSLHKLFQVPGGMGLSELVDERVELASVIEEVTGGVSLIPAGQMKGSLPLPDCARVCNNLRDRFRYVVIAGGPLLLTPDTVTLGSQCDGAVLALRAGLRHREDVLELQRELLRLRVRLFGAVLRERS